MVGENQSSVTFPSGIIKRLDQFISTEKADEMGLTSRPQVLIMLLRNFLEQVEEAEKNVRNKEFDNFQYIDKNDHKVVILDKFSNKEITIDIDDTGVHNCTNCTDSHCLHVKYILTLSDALNQVLSTGIELPEKLMKITT